MGEAGPEFSPPTKYVAGVIFILMVTLSMCWSFVGCGPSSDRAFACVLQKT